MPQSCKVYVGGDLANWILRTLKVSMPTGTPWSAKVRQLVKFDNTQPAVGQNFQVRLNDDSVVFNGSISVVGKAGNYEGSDYTWIDLDAQGYDTRLYQRLTRNPSTTEIAQYCSLSGHVNWATTVITWVDGDPFEPSMAGKDILIGASTAHITAVNSPFKMTTSTSATATGLTYNYDVYMGDAVKDLINRFAENEGFVYDGSSIVQGDKITERVVFFPPVTINDAITRLAALKDDYAYSVKPEVGNSGRIYFGLRTLTAAPFDFDNTDESERNVIITVSREDVRNVEVSQYNFDDAAVRTKTWTGDSTARSWFTDYPIGKVDHIELNGVTKRLGSHPDETDEPFVYRPSTRAVWQVAGDPVLTSGDSLKLFYWALGDDITESADATAITARQAIEGSGSGRYEMFRDRTKRGAVGAHNEGLSQVALLKDDLIKISIATFRNGLRPGMIQYVDIVNRPYATGFYYIDQVDASDTMEGSEIELEYTLSLISATRRVTSADVFREFGRGGVVISGSSLSQPGATAVPDPPTGLTYTPALYEYGSLTIENIAVTTPNSIRGIDIYLVTIDECQTDVYYTTGASSGTTDPLTIAATLNPDVVSDLRATIGNWIMFGDPGHFEWDLLTTGSGGGGSWTLARHYPGTATGDATFLSLLVSHASGTKLYAAKVRRFLFDSKEGGFGNGEIPTRLDCPGLPGVCVAAIVAAPYNEGGYGTWVVYNCATATVPGIRTLTGGDYTFQKAGNLTANAGVNAGISKAVQYLQPIRVMYAYVETAPTGADLIIKVRRSKNTGTTWDDLATLTIPAGVKYSYPGGTPPENVTNPYSGTWPWPFLTPGEMLNFTVEQVGSTIAGANLTVEVFT